MSTNTLVRLGLALAVSLQAACATTRSDGWDAGAQAAQDEELSPWVEAQELWEQRETRAGLLAVVERLEVAQNGPQRRAALAQLSRAQFLLGYLHGSDPAQSKAAWDQGVHWGEQALAQNAEFRATIQAQDGSLSDALQRTTTADLAAIYWTAVNLTNWMQDENLLTKLKYVDRVKAYVARLGELDRDFFHGAYYRFQGALLAELPALAGGDLDESRALFEAAIESSPDNFDNHMLFAEKYAVKADARDLYERELRFVIEADPSALPELAIEQRFEQQRARELLAEIDSLF